jgi:hypothetical protein
MGQTNANRVQVNESAYTFTEITLSDVLMEIDRRLTGRDINKVYTRTSGYISKIEYFVGSLKIVQRDFTRVSGVGGIQRVSSIVTTFYNSDTSIDSTITSTFTRDTPLPTNDKILSCSHVFATGEDICG